MQTIGVIGIGAMGMGIAVSLRRAGFEVLANDINPVQIRQAAAQGIADADSPVRLAAQCQILFIVVVDHHQIEQILVGQNALLPALTAGHTLLVCSTIAPEHMASIAQRAAERGCAFVDAPISGGPARAANGTMSMMLAAPSRVLEPLMPVLEAISARRFLISQQPGDASKAKLVNNLLAGIHLAAAAEAFALAQRFGLDSQQMFDLIQASSGQSWMLADRVPRALAGDLAARAAAPVITKDLRLATAAAAQLQLDTPLGNVAHEQMQQTCDQGWREYDDAAVISRLLGQSPPKRT